MNQHGKVDLKGVLDFLVTAIGLGVVILLIALLVSVFRTGPEESSLPSEENMSETESIADKKTKLGKPIPASINKELRKEQVLPYTVIHLKNGREIAGKIIDHDDQNITLWIENIGKLKFSSAEVDYIEELDSDIMSDGRTIERFGKKEAADEPSQTSRGGLEYIANFIKDGVAKK